MAWVKIITWMLLSMQRPYICPYTYSVFNPAVYWSYSYCYCYTVAAITLLLMLLYHRYYW